MLECRRCGYRSMTFDNFLDLSLPMPDQAKEVDLEECLEDFTSSSAMECGYRCKNCKVADEID